MLSCNPELAGFLTDTIGSGYKKDAEELEKLLAKKEDAAVLQELENIKLLKKNSLQLIFRKRKELRWIRIPSLTFR